MKGGTGYAEVAVNSPIAQRQTFSYAIASCTDLEIGKAVWAPFGSDILQGIVFEITDHPSVEQTREIAGYIDPAPELSPAQIVLARWISDYYLAPLFNAAALMLPPGFERKPVTFLQLSPQSRTLDTTSLTADERQLLHSIEEQEKVTLKIAEKSLGKKRARKVIEQLVRKNLVVKSRELERIKVKPKFMPYLRLAVEPELVRQEVKQLSRAPRQAALLELLISRRYLSLQEARRDVHCTPEVVKALEDKGLVIKEQVQVWRDPLLHRIFSPSIPPTLTASQEEALYQIQASLRQPKKDGASVFLLHGVTGSGKTEVYLRALAEAIALGKRGLVLVPEIALTPQTIERFASRFPGRVALLHSKLSLGEQFDEWQRIREGDFDVVIGPRGAIFAPQPALGIIVIDEEHEWTYKQQDQAPRYHAREVALKLAELTGAVVILGSATPDVESFYRAQHNKYRLLRLPERIAQHDGSALPEVEVIDMRQELREGNRSIFSRSLNKAIAETLTAKEQIILFLNRRGTATFIQCRNCGFVLKCRRCDLPLTLHATEEMIVCHQCNYRRAIPEICPECLSKRIKFLGIGTQRVEEEVARTFPEARLLRWDRDVTKGKYSHERILNKFLSHQADVLIGTQMIAKGLDLPSVTLVGIISADTILHFPDFRAGERTFQLISQVTGRAGRGSSPGRAIIQTYNPEHYAITAGAEHDYAALYRQEIDYRRQQENPPFSRLACLIYNHTNADSCQREVERVYHQLRQEIEAKDINYITLIGPSPLFFQKIRGRFRWQIILRGSDPTHLLDDLPLPQGWIVDIDPIGLL
ncbi:primosomal protein N' [Chloroflexota bacterium]